MDTDCTIYLLFYTCMNDSFGSSLMMEPSSSISIVIAVVNGSVRYDHYNHLRLSHSRTIVGGDISNDDNSNSSTIVLHYTGLSLVLSSTGGSLDGFINTIMSEVLEDGGSADRTSAGECANSIVSGGEPNDQTDSARSENSSIAEPVALGVGVEENNHSFNSTYRSGFPHCQNSATTMFWKIPMASLTK